MLTEEQDCSHIEVLIRIEDRRLPSKDPLHQRLQSRDEGESNADMRSRLFELNTAPASLAERFPRLIIFAAAATILLATLTAEIDYLRASGYSWP